MTHNNSLDPISRGFEVYSWDAELQQWHWVDSYSSKELATEGMKYWNVGMFMLQAPDQPDVFWDWSTKQWTAQQPQNRKLWGEWNGWKNKNTKT